MKFHERIAIVSVPIILLGVTTLFVFLVGELVEQLIPGTMSKPDLGTWETLLVVAGIFVAIGVGLYLGVIVWLACMRPFFSKDEILPYVSRPHIPLVTSSILLLFRLVYRNN